MAKNLRKPTLQDEVAFYTKERGYRDGWSAQQFLARQFAKMLEELAEAAEYLYFDCDVRTSLMGVGEIGRVKFKINDCWTDAHVPSFDYQKFELIKGELADCAVVLLNMADAVAEISGEEFDVIAAAVKKSRADIKRGVRDGRATGL